MISRLALYFGTTWQVNGLVISVLLTALLVANQIVEYFPKTLSRIWIVVPLLIGLVTANCFPFAGIPGPPAFVGALVVVVFSVPVLIAGLLFSLEFRGEAAPGAALGANGLGAVVGGLLENFSLLLGMRALLLITIWSLLHGRHRSLAATRRRKGRSSTNARGGRILSR